MLVPLYNVKHCEFAQVHFGKPTPFQTMYSLGLAFIIRQLNKSTSLVNEKVDLSRNKKMP